jgi:hypothetical protein
MMFLHATEARHLNNYEIELCFNDARKGVADLSSTLHGTMFEPLRDLQEVAKLCVDAELETVAWPNGADLAPEHSYYQAFKDDAELQEQFR